MFGLKGAPRGCGGSDDYLICVWNIMLMCECLVFHTCIPPEGRPGGCDDSDKRLICMCNL